MAKKISFAFSCILLIIPVLLFSSPVDELCKKYIQQWRLFYPSSALAFGDKESAFACEDFSQSAVNQWLRFNRSIAGNLDKLGSFQLLSKDDRIDARLLKRQVLSEIEKFEKGKLHQLSPSFYAETISQALTHLIARRDLDAAQTLKAVTNRLKAISTLCLTAQHQLKNGSPFNSQSALENLRMTGDFYEKDLPRTASIQKWVQPPGEKDFAGQCKKTADRIRALSTFIQEKIIPRMTLGDTLGEENYTRQLCIYTGSDLTPERLEEMALNEIDTVRRMMEKASFLYWEEQNPGKEHQGELRQVLNEALKAMEEHRVETQAEFLTLFKQLIDESEQFTREKKLATLPGSRTLYTDLSPAHFSGAAVGGVYPAGPFNPGADTLFYLPTVPDSESKEVKEGFYRSFNNHFNRMIITHEIYPGHYLQSKIASVNPRLVRSLFGDDLYVEGWASLCEQITLEAGWDKGDKLTYLAHLRKRLENAVRAYASVQVHCNGWNREKLTRFAVERGLLAPQFAINLWDRVMSSPMQITSYFLGFRAFSELLEEQQRQEGKSFSMQEFCDRILQAGAVPISELR